MVLNSRKEVRLFMKTEKEKMISGEKYNPANPRLVLERAEQIEFAPDIIKGHLMK